MAAAADRYGYRIKCSVCKYKAHGGGYLTTAQRDAALSAARNTHNTTMYGTNGDNAAGANVTQKQSAADANLTVVTDQHAAELQHVFKEQTTRQTNATTTYSTISGMTVTAAELTAGKTYYIEATAQLDCSAATTGARCKMVHGSTDFADSEFNQETNTATTGRMHYNWWTVWTAVASEALTLQFAPDGSATEGADQCTMVVFKLSDDLVQNTDWFSDLQTASTALVTTGDSTTGNASITIASPPANSKWIIKTKSRVTGTSTTNSTGSRMVRSGEASSTLPQTQLGGEDATNDKQVYALSAYIAPTGGVSNTFTEKGYAVGGNNGTRSHSGVFALNISKLKQDNLCQHSTTETSFFLSTTNFGNGINSFGITPDVTGDWWIFANMVFDMGSTTVQFRARLTLNTTGGTLTDQPATQTSDAYLSSTAWNTTDETAWAIQSVENLTAATAYTTTSYASASVVNTVKVDLLNLFAIPMELAAAVGGGDITKISSDVVNITEEIQRAKALGKVVSESVGITEAAGKSIARRPQAPDLVGVTEEALHFRARTKPATEELVSVTEQALYFRSRIKIVEEVVGIAEQVERLVSKIRTSNDTVGITEEPLRARTMAKAVNELVSVTEQTIRSKQITKIVSDVVGILEETSRARALSKSVEETVGITEESARQKLILKIVEDAVGISEEIIRSRGFVKIVEEPIGITEEVGHIRDRIRLVDETLTIGEAAVIARGIVKLVDEQVTVNEELQKSRNLIKVIDEAITISEELIRDKQIVRVVEEVLDLTESVNRALAMVRIIDETMTIDEVVGHVLAKTKVVDSEVVGINEVVNAVLTPIGNLMVKIVDETITISEDANRKTNLIRLVEENVQVAESVVKAAEMVKIVNESVVIAESVERARSLAKVIEEMVSIEEAATPIRALTKIVDEVVSLSEESISTIGKVRIVEETLQILESIVEKLAVYVPPPVAPVESRVGGVVRRRPRRFQTRKGYRIAHLGPRYYLAPPTPKIKAESLRRIEQRKVKQQLPRRYTVFVECKAVYSREAPAPTTADILNRLELDAIIERSRKAESITRQLQQNVFNDDTTNPSNPESIPLQIEAQQPIPAPIPIKTIVQAGVTIKYDKLAIFNTESVSRYDKFEIIKIESPQIKYDKFQFVKNEIVSQYTKKKPIPKNFENQVLTLEQMAKLLAMDDLIEQL